MPERVILEEQATLARIDDGFGFVYVIHANEHNPSHIHLYLTQADAKTNNTFTRLLIPNDTPKNITDIKTYSGDPILNNKQKKVVLEWFKASYKKNPILTNYVLAVSIWEVYQEDQEEAGN